VKLCSFRRKSEAPSFFLLLPSSFQGRRKKEERRKTPGYPLLILVIRNITCPQPRPQRKEGRGKKNKKSPSSEGILYISPIVSSILPSIVS